MTVVELVCFTQSVLSRPIKKAKSKSTQLNVIYIYIYIHVHMYIANIKFSMYGSV